MFCRIIAVSSSALAAPGLAGEAEVMDRSFRLAAWAAALLQGLLFLLMQWPGTALAFGESLLQMAVPAAGALAALAFALYPRSWEESALHALTFVGIMGVMVNGARFLMAVLAAGLGPPGEAGGSSRFGLLPGPSSPAFLSGFCS